MNIIITSLLTLSLLVVAPGCCGKNQCKATYIDANNNLQTEQLDPVCLDDNAPIVINIKC